MSNEVRIDAARIAPVAVTKYDKPFVVVLALENYERVTEVDVAIVVPASIKKARK